LQRGFSNKFNAYVGLKSILIKHRSVYGSHLIVVELVEQFNALIDEIVRVSSKAVYGTKKYTEKKHQKKSEMAQLASSMAAAGMVYALDRDNVEMQSALKWSYSKIKFATDTEALLRSGLIETTLRKHIAELEEYLISAKDLEMLRESIDEFEDILKERATERTENDVAHKQLKKLFEETDNHLYMKLDRMMLRIGDKNPDFYNTYRQARKIDDLR